jgi:hypothetical protein
MIPYSGGEIAHGISKEGIIASILHTIKTQIGAIDQHFDSDTGGTPAHDLLIHGHTGKFNPAFHGPDVGGIQQGIAAKVHVIAIGRVEAKGIILGARSHKTTGQQDNERDLFKGGVHILDFKYVFIAG